MVFARWQATIVDEAGNIQPGAAVSVRREVSGLPLAVLYSDRDGLVTAGNPITADANGFVAFYVAGGSYRIAATLGAFSREWMHVAIGTAAEYDISSYTPVIQQVDAGYALAFESEITAPPSAGAIRFNNVDLSAATEAYVSVETVAGSNIEARLIELYDAGRSVKDGIILTDLVNDKQASFSITGAAAAGSPTEYVTLTLSDHTGETSFTAGYRVNLQRDRAGADGEVTTANSPNTGEFARFTSGTEIEGRTVAETRGDLGLATTDVPQFAGIQLGDASDTTLTRTGAGDIAVEGNGVYRAGGTDVSVADGGTGASTAEGARVNLGVGMALLASGIITDDATLDIVLASYSGYRGFKIVGSLIPATDNVLLYARFSTDGGSNYDESGYSYAYHYITQTNYHGINYSGSANQIIIADSIGNNANEGVHFELDILNPTSGTLYSRCKHESSVVNFSGEYVFMNGGGMRQSAQNTDAIRLLFNSGNIASGPWAIYGML